MGSAARAKLDDEAAVVIGGVGSSSIIAVRFDVNRAIGIEGDGIIFGSIQVELLHRVGKTDPPPFFLF